MTDSTIYIIHLSLATVASPAKVYFADIYCKFGLEYTLLVWPWPRWPYLYLLSHNRNRILARRVSRRQSGYG